MLRFALGLSVGRGYGYSESKLLGLISMLMLICGLGSWESVLEGECQIGCYGLG